jgi:O-antigen/teichoic acid export membrane protein
MPRREPMSLFRRFFVGAGYSLLGASVHRVLLAIAAIATARLLGVREYGVYANLIAVVNLLMMFGLFGVNTAFASFLPRAGGPDRARQIVVAGALLVCILLTAVFALAWASASFVAGTLYRSVLTGENLRTALPYLAALTLNTLLLSALYGFQEFRRYSLSMIQLGVLVAAGSVIGVLWGGLRGLLLGGTAAYALNTVFIALTLRRLLGAGAAPSGPELRARAQELLGFALPAFLSALFLAPAYWLGNILMVRAGGPAPSGLFGVANSLAQLVLFIPATLAATLVPMFSEVAATADRARFSAFVARNCRMVWCINLPVTVLVGGAAPLLIGALYGAPYAPSVPAFVLLACSNLLVAVESVAAYVFIARRKMWEGFALNAIWFLVVLLLMAPLVRYGQTGFALVLLLAYAFHGVAVVVFLRRHVDLAPLAARAGPAAVLTLAAFALAAWTSLSGFPAPLVIALSGAGAAAAAVLEWRFILDADDRALVADTLRRLVRREPTTGGSAPG